MPYKHNMKRILYLLATLPLWVACDKTPVNGDLDGEWILQEIHSKTSPSDMQYNHKHTDKRQSPTFWNVAQQLIGINTPLELHNGKTNDTFCRFAYSGNRLNITDNYVHYRDSDSLLTDSSIQLLTEVGIRGNATTFEIKRLSGSQLILCSEMDSLIFRKKH